MRTKRSARGRFHRTSLRSDSATAARPLPPPITDDISNGNDNNADRMEVHSSIETDDNVSHSSGFSGPDKTNGFDKNTCLECDRGEQLLICCGIDCTIALHEKCISGEPKYDEGKFYCPYCWYKLLQARTEELRKKVMLARKDVNSFLNFRSEVTCGDKEKQNSKSAEQNDLNVRKIIGESNRCEHVKSMDVDEEVQNGAREMEEDHQHNINENLPSGDKSGEVAVRERAREGEEDHQHNINEKLQCGDQSGEVAECEKISATHAHEILEEEVGMEQGKNDEQDDDEKDEGTNADDGRGEALNAQCVAEKTVVDGAFQGSPGAKSETSNTSKRGRVSMEKEDQIDKDAPTANVSWTSVDGAFNGPDVPDSETENLVVRLRHVKRRESQNTDSPKKSALPTRSTKATGKPVDEVAPLKKPKQPKMPAIKFIGLPFAHEKRRRLLWKPEEEEMLREGVHKFSTTANKNLPWRKILEFGRHIFDPSRNPTDLKDKWRSIMAKES
ncbi:uncharacterized protein [Euphorbia lathyris]|uniref:uncharacterized protein n=1 Tax=Euphorbia lathyris TaxID=212925 RepID=UPI003313AF83